MLIFLKPRVCGRTIIDRNRVFNCVAVLGGGDVTDEVIYVADQTLQRTGEEENTSIMWQGLKRGDEEKLEKTDVGFLRLLEPKSEQSTRVGAGRV